MNVLSTTRENAARAARAAGYCAVALAEGLALVVLVPVLIYSAVLCLVGLGLLVLPPELRLLRRLADAERSRLGRRAAAAEPAGAHGGRRLMAVLADPATGRDLRWAPGMMVVGTVLGLLGAALFVFPAAVLVLVGLWWLFPADEPVRLMLDIPIDSWWAAVYAGVPQLLLSVLLALFGPPSLARAAVAASRRLLAQSPAAILAERVSTLDRTRTQVIDAHGSELRRIERDLHDGTQARLVSLAMQLGLAERTLGSDPAAVGPLLVRAREGAEEAMAELRDVLRSVYPPILADRGLAGAVSALVARCPIPATLEVSEPGEPGGPGEPGELGDVPVRVETAVYFAISEALTNAAKHSRADSVTVTLTRSCGAVRAEITDDGRGGAAAEGGGTGLLGMRQRVEAVDGVLRVHSPPGRGTAISVECPCAF